MRKEYNCQIYFALKGFGYGFPIILVATALMFFLIRFLHLLPSIGVILIICLWLIPFLFQKKIKDLFTKRATIGFDNEGFLITTYNLNNDDEVKKLIYRWDELKSYKFYFTPSKLTYLDIYFKNGTSKEFGFKDNKTEEESINGESIFSIFRTFAKQYNSNKEANEKIDFAPGVLTTVNGLIILYCLGILIVVDIVLHITKYDTNIGFLIMGSALLIGLIAKRKQQKTFYEKMSKLD